MLRYQYRLEGADDDWGAPGDQRTVTYARLAPGRYQFQVRADELRWRERQPAGDDHVHDSQSIWLRWWFVADAAFAEHGCSSTRSIGTAWRDCSRWPTCARASPRTCTTTSAPTSRASRCSAKSPAGTGRRRGLDRVHRPHRARVGQLDERHRVGHQSEARQPARSGSPNASARRRSLHASRHRAATSHAPDAGDSLKLGVDVRRDLLLIFKEAVNNAARHSRMLARGHRPARRRHRGSCCRSATTASGFDTSDGERRPGPGEHDAPRRTAQGHAGRQVPRDGGTTVTLSIPL